MRLKSGKAAGITQAAILLLGCIIMLYPFIWMISASFKQVPELYRIPPTIIPEAPTLDNYHVVMTQMNVLASMYKNSIVIALFRVVIQIVICSTAAFAFAKMKFFGKNVLFMLFMASMMIPGQMYVIPDYIIIKNLHLMDNIWSLILMGSFSAFFIFLLKQFFLTIPKELDEAAKMDGCSFLISFLSIHMPLAKPVIAVNVILTFIGSWGEFFGPLIFLKSIKNMTVPLGLNLLQGRYSIQSPTITVTSVVVSIIPVIIVFLIGRKQLIGGIATTGLKL